MQLPHSLTGAEATEQIDANASTIDTGEITERQIVHCFLGTFGADWDIKGIHNLLAMDGTTAAWQSTAFGVRLVVTTIENDAPRAYIFDHIEPDMNTHQEDQPT